MKEDKTLVCKECGKEAAALHAVRHANSVLAL